MVSHLQLLFILLALSASPPTTNADDQQTNKYYKCAQTSYNCGADKPYNVSFPFHFGDRPDYCGYPGYNLTCDGGDLILRMDGDDYRVVDANYSGQSIHVTSPRFDGQTCPPVATKGISLDFSLFDYSPDDVNFTIYSNCNPTKMSAFTYTYPLRCLPSNSSTASYYNVSKGISLVFAEARLACGAAAVVPITESTVNDLLRVGDGQLGKGLQAGFRLAWSIGGDWCAANCTSSGGVCGYDPADPAATPDGLTCYRIGVGESKSGNRKKIIAIGASAAGAGLIAVFFLGLFLYKRKRRQQHPASSTLLYRSTSSELSSKKDPELGNISGIDYQTHIFSYDELHEATNAFDASKELGDGGFGTVYKGKLRDGRIVAVKRLYESNYKRVEQFMNEVVILSRLRHQNLVTLYGCTSRHSRELLLVYEFVPKGTVADHLHGSRASEGGLTWPVRMSIAIETADALAYLHAVEPPIIHRDVKTNNILLDNSFHVKVADFGLSRLFPLDATHVSTAPQGTPGYVDPEYHQCYQLTDKSDVYSFGVVLMELISSMPAVDITRHRHEINLATMAMNKIQNQELDKFVDLELGYHSDVEVKRMITQVAELAFRCLQMDREMRPNVKEVLEELRGIEIGDAPKPEKLGDADIPTKEESRLLKNFPPYSPDSVADRWGSMSTTPNTSG